MGLQIQQRVTKKTKVITTLIAVFALVIQPYAGMMFGDAAYAAGNELTVCSVAGPDCDYVSVQDAVNAAHVGDTVSVAAGTYSAGQFLVLAAQAGITIQGAGVGQTIFNLTGASDGFKVQANGVTLKDFTITSNAHVATYGLRAQAIDNLTVDTVSVTNMVKTGFDINGVTNSHFSNLIAQGNGGAGIMVNDSKSLVFNNTTTNGNAWGGVALSVKGSSYPCGTDNIVFKGALSLSESTPMYTEKNAPAGPTCNITNISVPPSFLAAPGLTFPNEGVVRKSAPTNYSSWNAVDGAHITYNYQSAFDSAFTNIAVTINTGNVTSILNPGEPEGTYYWRVQTCDGVICSDWSAPRRIVIDNTAPVVASMTQAFEVHNSTEGRYAVTLNFNEPIASIDQGWSEVASSNKTQFVKRYYSPQQFTAQFKDIAGNAGSYTATISPVVNNSPVASFTSPTPADNAYVRGAVDANASATDDYGMGAVYVRFWKGAFESGTNNLLANCMNVPGTFKLGVSTTQTCTLNTKTANTPDGTKLTLSAQFLDGNGAYGTAFRTYTVDNTQPWAEIKTSSEGSVSQKIFKKADIKLRDNLKIVAYTINGTRVSVSPNTAGYGDVNNIKVGANHGVYGTNTIVVEDAAGNVSDPFTFTLDNVSPTSTVSYSPATRTSGNVMATLETNEPVQDIAGWLKKSPTKFQKAYPKNAQTPNYDQTVTIADIAGNTSTAHVYIDWIDIIAPAAPTDLVLTGSDNKVVASNGFTNVQQGILSWSDATSAPSDVDHYVYKFWTNIPGYFDDASNPWTTVVGDGYITKTATGGSIGTNFANNSVDKEGKYFFCIVAVDAVGNESPCSSTFAVTYDTTAPKISAGEYDKSLKTLTFTTTDADIAGLSVDVDEAGSKPATPNADRTVWTLDVSAFTEPRQHDYTVTAVDTTGNSSTTSDVSVDGQSVPRSFTIIALVTNPATPAEAAAANVSGTGSPSTSGFGAPANPANLFSGFATAPFAAAQAADDTAVLGAQDAKADTGILGASKDVAAITPSADGWKIFGFAWYLWALLIAAVAAIWWWIAAARRRSQDA